MFHVFKTLFRKQPEHTEPEPAAIHVSPVPVPEETPVESLQPCPESASEEVPAESAQPASAPEPAAEPPVPDCCKREWNINFDRVYSRQWEFDFPNGSPDEPDGEDEVVPSPSAAPTRPSPAALPELPRAYVVLDFETTGLSPERDCIIEIGAVRYMDGKEAAVMNSFVDPQRPISPEITRITGITDQDVAGAPTLRPAVESLHQFMDGLPIVAHNAGFDLSFLAAAYRTLGLEPDFTYLDTLELARRAFPDAPNHKLSTLIQFLSIDDTQAHRALSDVRQTHALLCRCAAVPGTKLNLKCFPAKPYQKRRSSSSGHSNFSPKDIVCTCESLDESHPLFQKRIVFTGELSLSRQQAAQMAADVGALVKSGVSGKTDYLVVGTQDLALVGADGMSSKEEKAYALNQAGKAHIQIIREQEFIDLVRAVEV